MHGTEHDLDGCDRRAVADDCLREVAVSAPIVHGTAAWHEARRRYVTASEVAAVLGEYPWKTRGQVMAEKLGVAQPDEENDAMAWGSLMETPMLEFMRKRWRWPLRTAQELVFDAACPRLAATPDAFLELPWGSALVEMKTTRQWPKTWAGKAPLYYEIQVNAQMACTGHRYGCVVALHLGTMEMKSYPVERNDRVIARIRREVEAFWSEVDAAAQPSK